MRNRILGYDVRLMRADDLHETTATARKLLSVDQSLWASAFNTGDYPDLAGREREERGLGTVKLPEFAIVGANRPFWSRLGPMVEYVEKHVPKWRRLYWVIAVTICLREPQRELKEREEWPYLSEPVPDAVQDTWAFIGYDVTSCHSESMISPRLGCTGEPGDARGLARGLNDHLLFATIYEACEFKEELDSRYEGEAPHLVYGIWRISEFTA
jgi:hypothetical protein